MPLPTKDISLVFIGSGPVAAAALKLLHQAFTIEAVITKPKPAHHRGSFPVVELAHQQGLELHEVSSGSELTRLIHQHRFRSQVAILIDFGIIVSQAVIDSFPFGIINSHFSVLPEWRGADPITFAILSGQSETGVTLMKLVAAMDEGPILGYATYPLAKTITTPELTNKLIQLSHELILQKLPPYLQEPQVLPQSTTGRSVSYSRKLTKRDGALDWHKPADQLEREVRAYQPWPGSYTTLAGKPVVILASKVATVTGRPGQVIRRSNELFICCQHNAVQILKLKPAGKNAMSIAAFLAGYGKNLTAQAG
jgi:methionyl-tRNA formyltransferase